jgi:predicted DNA-binding ribbon-helix-helix protein
MAGYGDLALARDQVTWYIVTNEEPMAETRKHIVERVQTGVRMEKRLLKVLKAFADYHDLTLGDLLEGIVLHAFDGKCPFNQANRLRIRELKKFYGLDLDSRASHRLVEARDSLKRARGTQ